MQPGNKSKMDDWGFPYADKLSTDVCSRGVIFPRWWFPYLWRFERVVCGEMYGQKENPALVRTVILKEKHQNMFLLLPSARMIKTSIQGGTLRHRMAVQESHLFSRLHQDKYIQLLSRKKSWQNSADHKDPFLSFPSSLTTGIRLTLQIRNFHKPLEFLLHVYRYLHLESLFSQLTCV